MKRKVSVFLLLLMVASMLMACGSSATNTPVPVATTAAAQPTTAAAQATTASAKPTTAAAQATTAAAQSTTAASQATTAPAQVGGEVLPAAPLPPLPADAKKGGNLVAASMGLHPDLAPVTVSASVVAQRYSASHLLWANGLAEYNYTSLKWELDLAKELKIDPTGKIYTYTLRPDLKWSDNKPITPDDFVFTFDNISKPNPANPALSYSSLQNMALITSYKGDNAANTVTITMDKTYNRDVAINNHTFAIAPKHVWEGKPFFDRAANPEITKPTVVNGPYTLVSFDDKAEGVFKVNPNWHRGKPNFDQITVKSYAPTTISEALKSGQVDVSFTTLPSAFFKDLQSSPNLDMKEWKGVQDNIRYIVFNTTAAPFNDKALRLAIAHSVDRAEMIALAEAGRASPAFSLIPEESPFYNPELPKYPLDLAKANQILTEGGYKKDGATLLGKDGKPLKFNVSHSGNDLGGKALATYVQARLKPLGIEVEVQSKDPGTYLTDLVTQKYDAGIGLVGDLVFPDPDTQKTFYISTGIYNVAKLVIPRVDEIFNNLGPVETDNTKRKALYFEALKLVLENVPSVGFYRVVSYTAANKKLGGIDPTKAGFKGGYIYNNYAVASWYFKS